jgi:serine/threonine protein phosphatase PrpC
MNFDRDSLINNVSILLRDFIQEVNPNGSNKLIIETNKIYLCSSKGTRDINQDRVMFALIENQRYSGTQLAIAVLADGMGGMLEGDKAASLAISSFILYLAASVSDLGLKQLTISAARYADKEVNNVFKGKGGSTFSAIIYGRKGCVALNVGDSRIYYYDQTNGLKLLTIDDTISGQLHKDHLESDYLNEFDFGDNRLIQYIGMGEGLAPHCLDLSEYFHNNDLGNAYLITSDGAHYLGKDILQRIIKLSHEQDQIPYRIVTTSEWLGGFDNSSVIYSPIKFNFNELHNKKESILKIYTISKEIILIIPPYFILQTADAHSSANIKLPERRDVESQIDKPKRKRKSSVITELKKNKNKKALKTKEGPPLTVVSQDDIKTKGKKNNLTLEFISSDYDNDKSSK